MDCKRSLQSHGDEVSVVDQDEMTPLVKENRRIIRGIVGEFFRLATRRKSYAAKFFLIKLFDSACEIVFSGGTRSIRTDPRPTSWLELWPCFRNISFSSWPMPKSRHFLACSKIPLSWYFGPNGKFFTFSCQTFHGLSYDLPTLSRSLAPIESKKIYISYTKDGGGPFSHYTKS